MAERQYRVDPAVNVAVGNMRQEASQEAEIVVQLKRGQIVSDDPERTADGDWLPVKFRGWMHKSILEALDA